MTPGLVSVIILNWNGAKFLGACLAAVRAQDYRPLEIIVVDNASTDRSADGLGPDVRLVRNRTNLGFAAGYNGVLAQAAGEFVLLLNYDALIEPGYVRILVEDQRRDPGLGSASGKLRRPARPGETPLIDSAGHVMYRNVWPANRAEDEPDQPAVNLSQEVFGVCAAAALYRTAMLQDVMVDGEVFDSAFFAYLEDADLDWRARLRGWRSWYDPRAVAIHQRGGSGAWFSTRIQRHILKNRLLMIIKNDSGWSFWGRAPAIVAFTAAKGLQLLLNRPAALLGFADVVRLLPRTLRQRRLIQSRRKVPPASIDPWLQPYPYLRKLRSGRLGRARRPPVRES
ncbi:MAG TPA: glycosyltransferase family 2 protein [Candidatus Dormibacteraeota bacterium]|nr:glycosyltransferase family 2 protein [Candidatus Dormibacteraeota bacterium]